MCWASHHESAPRRPPSTVPGRDFSQIVIFTDAPESSVTYPTCCWLGDSGSNSFVTVPWMSASYCRGSISPAMRRSVPTSKRSPDREAYEQWADTVPAATVALPLTGATDVANALAAPSLRSS